MALQGANERRKLDQQQLITCGWLIGKLTGLAMSTAEYPKLSALLGEDEPQPSASPEVQAADASANARAWGVWLQVVNRQSEKRK